MRVLLLHGLESGPNGNKALFLRDHFAHYCPALDTAPVRAAMEAGTGIRAATANAIGQAQEALSAFQPDVVVGSSFGGAVLHHLIHEGVWSGPSVLLASAGTKLLGLSGFRHQPKRLVMVHGTKDEVVPFEDSRALLTAAPASVLLAVDDGHRLHSIMAGRDPLLLTAIRMASTPS
jgi:predicted esterase YcpF (UPF0227 family)